MRFNEGDSTQKKLSDALDILGNEFETKMVITIDEGRVSSGYHGAAGPVQVARLLEAIYSTMNNNGAEIVFKMGLMMFTQKFMSGELDENEEEDDE